MLDIGHDVFFTLHESARDRDTGWYFSTLGGVTPVALRASFRYPSANHSSLGSASEKEGKMVLTNPSTSDPVEKSIEG